MATLSEKAKQLVKDEIKEQIKEAYQKGLEGSDQFKELSKRQPNKLYPGMSEKWNKEQGFDSAYDLDTGVVSHSPKKLHNFDNYELADDGGFSGNDGLSDFLQAVKNNDIRALSNCQITEKDISTDISPGSFCVPSKFLAQMIDFMSEESIVMPRATHYKLARGQGNSLTIPCYDATDFTEGKVSGISLEFVPEGGSMTETTPKLRQVKLELNKIAGYVEVTDETLMSSAINTSELISGLFGRALAFMLDRNFILTGTGAGRPLSIVSGGDFLGVAGESGQDAGTIVVENVSGMLKKLAVGAWKRGLFLANVSLIDDLMRLAWATGTSYIPCPAYNSKTGRWNIMGIDLKFSQHTNYIGSKNCLILADFSRYLVLTRDQMTIKFDPYTQATSGKNRYILNYFVDGQSADNNDTQYADGTSTVSSFVGINAIA